MTVPAITTVVAMMATIRIFSHAFIFFFTLVFPFKVPLCLSGHNVFVIILNTYRFSNVTNDNSLREVNLPWENDT